ncbi:MAG: tetratricopeptide repeat protein [Actinomycetota bacterium]
MKRENQRQRWIFTLVLVFAFLINGLSLQAQDVVTSEDFTGGSSAFVFKSARKAAQKKVAFTAVKRTKTAKLETSKRIIKQTVTVAKVNPKRTKSKEVNPNTIPLDSVAFKRKSPQETSVIFAGVGEYYLNQDDIDKSVEFFRESAQLDEKNGNAKTGLSEALTRKGDDLLSKENYEIAKLLYDEAVKINPKNAAAQAGLAEIYSSKDDTDGAIASYEKALSFDADLTELNAPLGVLYFQKGEIAKSEIFLQKAVAANPNNAETQFFLGLLRYKQERYEDAVSAFKRSLELDPNNAEIHYYLGEAYDHLKSDKEVIDEYQKAVGLNPKYTEAWFDLGVAYFNRDRLSEAINAYKEAIKLKPNYGEAHANLADVYRLTNKLDEAIGEYRLATTFIKTDAELFSKFGYVAARRATNPAYKSFWKTAIDNFEKAVALTPDYIDYTNLGWAYYNSAQTSLKDKNETEYKANLIKARDSFEKANTLKPIPKVAAAINLNLGMTLTDLGDYQSSINALKLATDLQKDWLPAINELGIAYRKSGDLENAVKQFRKAIDTDDKFAPAHFNLAESEYRRGNLKEAKKEYQKLKTLNRPDLVSGLELVTNGGILK